MERVNCATPFTKVAVGKKAELDVSKKLTVPVGVPQVCGCAVAERVKGCPYATVFTLLLSVSVVCAWLTVSVTGAEVLAKKFASPLYVAVI